MNSRKYFIAIGIFLVAFLVFFNKDRYQWKDVTDDYPSLIGTWLLQDSEFVGETMLADSSSKLSLSEDLSASDSKILRKEERKQKNSRPSQQTTESVISFGPRYSVIYDGIAYEIFFPKLFHFSIIDGAKCDRKRIYLLGRCVYCDKSSVQIEWELAVDPETLESKRVFVTDSLPLSRCSLFFPKKALRFFKLNSELHEYVKGDPRVDETCVYFFKQ